MPYSLRTRLSHRFKDKTPLAPEVVRSTEHTIHHADFALVLAAAKTGITNNANVEVSDIGTGNISRMHANLNGVIGLSDKPETYNYKLFLSEYNEIRGTDIQLILPSIEEETARNAEKAKVIAVLNDFFMKEKLSEYNYVGAPDNRCSFIITPDRKKYGVATLIWGKEILTFDRSI